MINDIYLVINPCYNYYVPHSFYILLQLQLFLQKDDQYQSGSLQEDRHVQHPARVQISTGPQVPVI